MPVSIDDSDFIAQTSVPLTVSLGSSANINRKIVALITAIHESANIGINSVQLKQGAVTLGNFTPVINTSVYVHIGQETQHAYLRTWIGYFDAVPASATLSVVAYLSTTPYYAALGAYALSYCKSGAPDDTDSATANHGTPPTTISLSLSPDEDESIHLTNVLASYVDTSLLCGGTRDAYDHSSILFSGGYIDIWHAIGHEIRSSSSTDTITWYDVGNDVTAISGGVNIGFSDVLAVKGGPFLPNLC
jgi:hypothetical protein